MLFLSEAYLSSLKRAELQTIAKKHNVKANNKTAMIIKELTALGERDRHCIDNKTHSEDSSCIETSAEETIATPDPILTTKILTADGKQTATNASSNFELNLTNTSRCDTEDDCLRALEVLMTGNDQNSENILPENDEKIVQKSIDCDRLRAAFSDATNAANNAIHKDNILLSPKLMMFSPKTKKALRKQVPKEKEGLSCKDAKGTVFSPTTRANFAVMNY